MRNISISINTVRDEAAGYHTVAIDHADQERSLGVAFAIPSDYTPENAAKAIAEGVELAVTRALNE